MYKQIVVPLDGSEQAEDAMRVAARIARHEGAAITLMQVVTAEAARGGDAVPVRVGELTERDDRRSAAEYLQRTAQAPALRGVPTETVVRDGSPAEQIEAEAVRRGADLIVLSHRQHGPAASFFLGSVADALLRHAQIPILVLDSDDAARLGGASTAAAARPVRALVPLDGSRPAEQAIPRAIELLRALETGRGATIHLAYVMDPKRAFRYDTPETAALHRARAYLETTAERVATDPANISITV
ncbi:MAG TPA: universal stress protein, partial [Ktedonobacterales bacterium]|nr:universal stress protein [Ktedonobacterales bacterium]